jgi:uncharacterized protein (DUF427 family)
MRATWNGRVIAQSDETIEVDGYTYFPRAKVTMDLLKASPKTESDLECPNGVQFYDLSDGKSESERAAWSYEKPTRSKLKEVDHWLAFWEDVEVEE